MLDSGLSESLFPLKMGGSRPKRGCLLSLACYAYPRWYEFGERLWNDIDRGKTEELVDKPVPVPFCPPQIPHGLTRSRTRASAVRGRRLTTWAMTRPTVWVTGRDLHDIFLLGCTAVFRRTALIILTYAVIFSGAFTPPLCTY